MKEVSSALSARRKDRFVVKIQGVKVRGTTVKQKVGDSVYKYYCLSWNEDGKRKKSTAGTEYEEAVGKAEKIAGRVARARFDLAGMTDDEMKEVRYARSMAAQLNIPLTEIVNDYSQAHGILPPGKSLADAVSFFLQYKDHFNFKMKPLREVAAEFLAFKATEKLAPLYLASLRRGCDRINGFKQHDKKCGDMPISGITTGDLNAYLMQFEDITTRRLMRAHLTALFRYARDQGGCLPRDKQTEAERCQKVEPKLFEAQPFNVDKFAVLWEAVTEERPRLFLAIAAFAGLRPSEVYRLEWDKHIQMEQKRILLPPSRTKTGVGRAIAMPDNLHAVLSRYAKKEGPLGITEFHARLVRRKSLELKLGWHHDTLRHSAVSYMFAVKEELGWVASWAGHDEETMKKHYLSVNVTKDNAERFFEFGRLLHGPEDLKRRRALIEAEKKQKAKGRGRRIGRRGAAPLALAA